MDSPSNELDALRQQLAEERRLREAADRRVAEEQRLREAADRRVAEEQRLREAADRRSAEREISEAESRVALQRAIEAARDAQAASVLYMQQLAAANDEIQQSRMLQQPQSFAAYLVQTSRMTQHLSRLIPPAATAAAAAAAAAARAVREHSETKSTSTGQTSIRGKYYPLHLRPWLEFPQLQREAFHRLHASLTADVFPSPQQVQAEERILLDRIPTEFLYTDTFLNAARTSQFLDATLERPASKAFAKYLETVEDGKMVFFDNVTAGVASIMSTPRAASNSDAANNDANANPERSARSSPARPKKTRPDCVVLTASVDAASRTTSSHSRLLVGEHKACHTQRMVDLVPPSPPLTEDYLIRLAIAAQAHRQRKEARLATRAARNALAASVLTPVVPDSPSANNSDLPKSSSSLSYFASALAQTFHYMLLSGLEYGYLASGETLCLLRIPEDDPTTLLYHPCFFPATPPEDLPRLQDGSPDFPESVVGGTAADQGTLPGDDVLSQLAISQLSVLCLLALNSPVRDPNWISRAYAQLAEFPSLPSGYAQQGRNAIPSSLGVRRRDSDDDDSGESGDDGGTTRGRHSRVVALQSQPTRGRSPLRQTQLITDHTVDSTETSSQTAASIKYCSQACLLGLKRGLPLDARCPNYTLHVAGASSELQQQQEQHHAITQSDVVDLVNAQLRRSVMENCVCLYDKGCRGAIGCLLKISLTGYGYTFVAKGVERWNAHRLAHETYIYDQLRPLQGSVIPVHLGLFELRVPYPHMAKFTTLTHLMLMSHTGESLRYSRLESMSERIGHNLDEGIVDVYEELREWGVEDHDETMCNATWCEETQRVMKIDFDNADLDKTVYRRKLQSVEQAANAEDEKADEAEADKTNGPGETLAKRKMILSPDITPSNIRPTKTTRLE